MTTVGGKKEEESQQDFLIPHVRLPINALIIINDFFFSAARRPNCIDAALSCVVFHSKMKKRENSAAAKDNLFPPRHKCCFALLSSESVV